MPDHAVIRHTMSLLLRLRDTATGMGVSGKSVTLLRNGTVIHPLLKDESYIFMDAAREDFELGVRAAGFEPCAVSVRHGELAKELPALEVQLIPSERYTGSPVYTLEGSLPGIEALDAVKLGEGYCLIREFDERKRLMTIFNPHNLALDLQYYAVLSPDDGTYEPFAVERLVTSQQLKIDRKLQRAFANHFPVSRVIFGRVGPDGAYLLRVANRTTDARWAVRCKVGGQERFQVVDFAGTGPHELTALGGGG